MTNSGNNAVPKAEFRAVDRNETTASGPHLDDPAHTYQELNVEEVFRYHDRRLETLLLIARRGSPTRNQIYRASTSRRPNADQLFNGFDAQKED
jgi:hypothetical protein